MGERNLRRRKQREKGAGSDWKVTVKKIESEEEIIYRGNEEEEVRRDDAMHVRNTHRRVRKGDRNKIKRMGEDSSRSGNLE